MIALPFALPRLSLSTWLSIGLGVALALSAVALEIQKSRLAAAKAEVSTLEAKLSEAQASQREANAIVLRMKEANARLVQVIGEQENRIIAACAAVVQLQNSLRIQNERRRQLEEQDRANPKCKALLVSDIADACPAIAAGMRERARAEIH